MAIADCLPHTMVSHVDMAQLRVDWVSGRGIGALAVGVQVCGAGLLEPEILQDGPDGDSTHGRRACRDLARTQGAGCTKVADCRPLGLQGGEKIGAMETLQTVWPLGPGRGARCGAVTQLKEGGLGEGFVLALSAPEGP